MLYVEGSSSESLPSVAGQQQPQQYDQIPFRKLAKTSTKRPGRTLLGARGEAALRSPPTLAHICSSAKVAIRFVPVPV